MNILLTNDDGYNCAGIKTLAKYLSKEHNVYIVAPDSERSCSSHIVSFLQLVDYKYLGKIDGIETYTCSGSPADCVIFGIKQILKDKNINCVVAGINTVMNVGSDILYSGTFGAAQEGTFQGLPSIAVSLYEHHTNYFDDAAEFTLKNFDELLKYATKNITINVNIPYPHKEDLKGVKVAPVTFRPYNEDAYEHINEDGSKSYYIKGKPILQTEENKDGDCYLVEHGYIAVTPVPMILNDYNHLKLMEKADYKL